ncbi:7798_t:CDS:2 [Ambispora gerdemannii]|uniref:7798_t:CDS:1 n=1 Tax=Ambispora gerdemannii TaxID=144530 RepID=A0A9N9DKB4_9GLOM|nr:7798_t:CDS:2 [Ambispora gerdemannii]
MVKVRILQDTKSMESKKIQGQGYRLGSTREQELEEALRDSIKSNSEITNDELKQMKDDLALKTSEIHSLESKLSLEPIKIGGETDEKKIPNSISQSDDAIASDIPSKDLSQYFIRGKGTDQVGKINTDILDRTDDKSASIPEELVI